MMPLEHWLAFVAASAALLAIPGPTILTVVAYSVSHGMRSRAALVLAVALGDATALAFSLLGLGGLLAVSATSFTVVKILGGAYLIWLGLRMIWSAVQERPEARSAFAVAPVDELESRGQRRLFVQTWLVTALNPKGIIFFVAFLPQFVDRAQPMNPQLWLLALTFVGLAAINAGLYATFVAHARRMLAGEVATKVFGLMGGGLLVAAGGWALSARRAA